MEAALGGEQPQVSASRHCAPTHVPREKASVTRQVLSLLLACCLHTHRHEPNDGPCHLLDGLDRINTP
eukprot:472104-Pelagomonas_calceolata.AAC.1